MNLETDDLMDEEVKDFNQAGSSKLQATEANPRLQANVSLMGHGTEGQSSSCDYPASRACILTSTVGPLNEDASGLGHSLDQEMGITCMGQDINPSANHKKSTTQLHENSPIAPKEREMETMPLSGLFRSLNQLEGISVDRPLSPTTQQFRLENTFEADKRNFYDEEIHSEDERLAENPENHTSDKDAREVRERQVIRAYETQESSNLVYVPTQGHSPSDADDEVVESSVGELRLKHKDDVMIEARTENFSDEESEDGKEWGAKIQQLMDDTDLQCATPRTTTKTRVDPPPSSSRKSKRQSIKWGNRTVSTKDLIANAVKARTPVPTTEGMSLFEFVNDSILLHLSTVLGVSLGSNDLMVRDNIIKLRKLEADRHLSWAKNGVLQTIEEELELPPQCQ